MRKLLIPIAIIATLFVSGCAQDPIVDRLPWVHRIEIQQGNVITQADINQLKPGISKRQVLFLLGTSMVTDPFHANRWDYVYLLDPGSGDGEAANNRVTLFFEEDVLTHLSGNIQPNLAASGEPARKLNTVTVPPQHTADQGILTRFWHWLGFGNQS